METDRDKIIDAITSIRPYRSEAFDWLYTLSIFDLKSILINLEEERDDYDNRRGVFVDNPHYIRPRTGRIGHLSIVRDRK